MLSTFLTYIFFIFLFHFPLSYPTFPNIPIFYHAKSLCLYCYTWQGVSLIVPNIHKEYQYIFVILRFRWCWLYKHASRSIHASGHVMRWCLHPLKRSEDQAGSILPGCQCSPDFRDAWQYDKRRRENSTSGDVQAILFYFLLVLLFAWVVRLGCQGLHVCQAVNRSGGFNRRIQADIFKRLHPADSSWFFWKYIFNFHPLMLCPSWQFDHASASGQGLLLMMIDRQADFIFFADAVILGWCMDILPLVTMD